MTTSVIIPYYNNWHLTHARLGELYRYESEPLEIILVNDASTEIDCKTMPAFWQNLNTQHTIKYVENKENLGFGGSHNRGAKVATGDILVFLSNDVVIGGKFIQKIEEILYERKGEAIVAGEVLYNDTGWNTLMLNGKKSIVVYPVGWLISTTKDMWKRIGGWDVEHFGRFDYEDIALGAWALYNGVDLVGLNLPYLHHLFGQTIGKVYPDRQKYSEHNREVFRELWTKRLEEKYA